MVVAAIKGFVPNSPDFYEKYRFMSVRPSVFGITLLEERPYISNDVSHDPLSVGQPPGHPPVETFLGVPLRVASTLIGLIGVANKPEGYDGDDERLLSTFANQVAVALDNARLYQQQREMIQQLISLVELATEVSSSRPVQHRDDDRAGEGVLGPFSFGPAQTPEPDTRTLSDTQARDPLARRGRPVEPGDRGAGPSQRAHGEVPPPGDLSEALGPKPCRGREQSHRATG